MNKIVQQIDLYKKNYSSREIASMLNMTSAGVRSNIRRLGLSRKSLGILIEDKIEQWFIKNNYNVKRQKGDAYFDLLINEEKVDVKSANLCFDKSNKTSAYWFQLCDITNRLDYKNLNTIDYFLLVFIDKPKMPIYKINSSEITAKTTLRIPENLNGKYRLNFLGYLEEVLN